MFGKNPYPRRWIEGIHYEKIDHPTYKYRTLRVVTIQTSHQGLVVGHRFFQLDFNGILSIFAGYCWDGATCAIDTKSFMRPSCGHDVNFQILREGLIKFWSPQERIDFFNDANTDLRVHCIEDGMFRLRAWPVYWAVSVAGKKYAGM